MDKDKIRILIEKAIELVETLELASLLYMDKDEIDRDHELDDALKNSLKTSTEIRDSLREMSTK